MVIRFLLGCVLLAGGSSVSAGTCEDNGLAVLEAAAEYEGVREATGRNDGPAVEFMLARVHLSKGAPWCGAYVWTGHVDAGLVVAGGARAFAWAPTWHPAARQVWTRAKGNSTTYKGKGQKRPMPGDVFGLYYANLGRIGHVGFWVKEEGKYVITLEGNTNADGSREGDGVCRKRRRKDQLYCVSRWTC